MKRGCDPVHTDPVARDVALLKQTRRFARIGVLITFLYRAHRVSIVNLTVQPGFRGRGLARTALGEVCRWADEYGFALGISPTDEYGADLDRLRAFYSRFGFVDDVEPSAPDLMVRQWRGQGTARRE